MREKQSTKIIKLDLLDENGVKYEDISKFNESLFRNVYYESFVNTWKLIRHNKDYKETDSQWKRDRMYNIISFWGPRGMGKTSVMRSFLGELDNFSPEKYRRYYAETTREKGVYGLDDMGTLPKADELEKCAFIFLECIDASLLAEDEDIFEVILAKMLDRLLPILRDYHDSREWTVKGREGYLRYTKEELIAQFDDLHKYLVNMRDIKGRRSDGTGAVEILKDLSGSLDLREKFKEMVPLYLEVMLKGEKRNAEHKMLVISIDDIDMKLSGYNMLEQLHRYFMIPDVLIYITVAESELFATCYQHFMTNAKDGATTQEKQRKLAKAYIDKVLPFSKRIYMPVLYGFGQEIKFKSNGTDTTPDKKIKEDILHRIASGTEIYFDGCGVKRHFYEPENIRELVNLNAVLSKISSLSDNQRWQQYTNNMSVIMNDIIYRLAPRNLGGNLRDSFATIAEMNQDRQGAAFLQIIVESLDDENHDDENTYIRDYKQYGYSYGELLRGLYVWGRKNRANKNFVQCVLALESAQMTDLYQKFVRLEQSVQTAGDRKFIQYFKNSVRGSVSGSWGNKLVPRLEPPRTDIDKSQVSWGFVKGRYEREKENAELFLYTVDENKDSYDTKYKVCLAMLEDEELKLVQSLELLCMFLTSHQLYGGVNWFELQELKSEEIIFSKKE